MAAGASTCGLGLLHTHYYLVCSDMLMVSHGTLVLVPQHAQQKLPSSQMAVLRHKACCLSDAISMSDQEQSVNFVQEQCGVQMESAAVHMFSLPKGTGKQRACCVAPGVPLVMATAPGPHAQLLHNMCQRRYWDTLDIRQYLTRIDKPPRLRLEPSQGAR